MPQALKRSRQGWRNIRSKCLQAVMTKTIQTEWEALTLTAEPQSNFNNFNQSRPHSGRKLLPLVQNKKWRCWKLKKVHNFAAESFPERLTCAVIYDIRSEYCCHKIAADGAHGAVSVAFWGVLRQKTIVHLECWLIYPVLLEKIKEWWG